MTLYQNTEEFDKAQANKERISKETAAGKKAARALQTELRTLIAIETVRRTGELLKSNVQTFIEKDEGLKKLYFNGPKYGYILNYGFLGVRAGGISMHLDKTAHITDAIESAHIVEILATEITEIRAEQMVANIKF